MTAGGSTDKTVGLIGGIGPESTIEYYRHLIELPLIFREATSAFLPLLDTTAIHVDRIVAEMLGGS
jgi:aspartate/glutamate racemase